MAPTIQDFDEGPLTSKNWARYITIGACANVWRGEYIDFGETPEVHHMLRTTFCPTQQRVVVKFQTAVKWPKGDAANQRALRWNDIFQHINDCILFSDDVLAANACVVWETTGSIPDELFDHMRTYPGALYQYCRRTSCWMIDHETVKAIMLSHVHTHLQYAVLYAINVMNNRWLALEDMMDPMGVSAISDSYDASLRPDRAYYVSR